VTAGYVTVTLMTFDKQSNGRRIYVKSVAATIA